MRKTIFFIASFIFAISTKAQETATTPAQSKWNHQGSTSLTFGQTSFTNWSAGGENSISVLGAFKYKLEYKSDKVSWNNNADLGYGLSYQGTEQIKNDDHLNLATNFGYQASKLWYYASELSFKSQFYKGYAAYPVLPENRDTYISKFMSPGYLIASLGLSYHHPSEDLKILISAGSEKMTFVTDKRLYNSGSYGVPQGKRFKAEFGALVKGVYSKKLKDNILIGTTLSLTSAYQTFGNVDVDWIASLDWKINRYFTFKASTFLLYDDDIKYISRDGVKSGARIQFKEVTGLGFGYIF